MKFRKVLGLTLVGTMALSTFIASAEYNPGKIVTGPITTLSIDATEKPQDSYEGIHFSLVVNNKGLDAKVYTSEEGTIMIPLRTISEALGYEVKWNMEKRVIELTKGAHFITAKAEEDYYTFGKMAPMKLGTASELLEGRTYVPLNFVNDVLRIDGQVDETGVITISSEKETYIKKTGTINKVISREKTNQILIGDMTDGIILNITDQTEITTKDNEKLTFEDLKEGMEIEAFHDLIMTMSLPPISNAQKIIVK